MELLRTDVLGRECHPYGICSSISAGTQRLRAGLSYAAAPRLGCGYGSVPPLRGSSIAGAGILGRECHPYGICSSISPVPSAYALGYPVPPLRG
jgi:hypothetical protein